jgi:Fe-S oxidoreductase
VEELVATGAQTIGTACPFCQTMFRDALGAVPGSSGGAIPKLMDIVQLVAAGLPAERE